MEYDTTSIGEVFQPWLERSTLQISAATAADELFPLYLEMDLEQTSARKPGQTIKKEAGFYFLIKFCISYTYTLWLRYLHLMALAFTGLHHGTREGKYYLVCILLSCTHLCETRLFAKSIKSLSNSNSVHQLGFLNFCLTV